MFLITGSFLERINGWSGNDQKKKTHRSDHRRYCFRFLVCMKGEKKNERFESNLRMYIQLSTHQSCSTLGIISEKKRKKILGKKHHAKFDEENLFFWGGGASQSKHF